MATPGYIIQNVKDFAEDVLENEHKLIVYVVGAGASRAFEKAYPLGADLAEEFRRSAARITAWEAEYAIYNETSPGLLEYDSGFGQTWVLRGSGQRSDLVHFAVQANRYFADPRGGNSVDAFLASLNQGGDFKRGGEPTGARAYARFALAGRLYKAEGDHLHRVAKGLEVHGRELRRPGSKIVWPREAWDWLSPVMDRILEDARNGKPGWRHAFVTFNYDRSVEYALAKRFAAEEGLEMPEAFAEAMRRAPVLHAHGALYNAREDGEYPAYGYGGVRSKEDERSNLQIVGEAEESFWAESGVRELMDAASRVVFLGFGYDERNLRRVRPTSANRGGPDLDLIGTAYGPTDQRYDIVHTVARSFGQPRPIRLGAPGEDCMALVSHYDIWGELPRRRPA